MASASNRVLKVVVVYAAPGVEAQLDLTLPAGSVVADAVEASGFIDRFIRAVWLKRQHCCVGGEAMQAAVCL